jgi:hypothetical protein
VDVSGEIPDADRLLQHVEACLGPLDESRCVSEPALREAGAAFAVLAFASDAGPTYTTFGLSRHLLRGSGGGPVSQELVLGVDDDRFAVDVLRVVGSHVLARHRAVAAGERHELPGWNSQSEIEGVMAVPETTVGPCADATARVEFVRLLPITATEAARAGERGWEDLAEHLGRPDATARDLFRRSVA